jgi:hypothetical protein
VEQWTTERTWSHSSQFSMFCLQYSVTKHNIQNVPQGKVIGSVILSKKKCICTCVLFRTVSEIELFHCTVPKLLIRNRYHVLFLLQVFNLLLLHRTLLGSVTRQRPVKT